MKGVRGWDSRLQIENKTENRFWPPSVSLYSLYLFGLSVLWPRLCPTPHNACYCSPLSDRSVSRLSVIFGYFSLVSSALLWLSLFPLLKVFSCLSCPLGLSFLLLYLFPVSLSQLFLLFILYFQVPLSNSWFPFLLVSESLYGPATLSCCLQSVRQRVAGERHGAVSSFCPLL